MKKLGEGGFAECYEIVQQTGPKNLCVCAEYFPMLEGRCMCGGRGRYAVKVFNKRKLIRSRRRLVDSEIKIHQSLSHPHIVQFLDHHEDSGHVYIIMELCLHNSLTEFVKTFPDVHQESRIRQLIRQLSEAVLYLKEKNIIHRDIKPDNIFMTVDGTVRLGDFGIACELGDELRTTKCGTYKYMSPEMCQDKRYDYTVDVWAIGVVTYWALTKEEPFRLSAITGFFGGRFAIHEMMEAIKIAAYDHLSVMLDGDDDYEETNLSDDAKRFVGTILVADPAKRPIIEHLLCSAFLALPRTHRLVLGKAGVGRPRIMTALELRAYRKYQAARSEGWCDNIDVAGRVEPAGGRGRGRTCVAQGTVGVGRMAPVAHMGSRIPPTVKEADNSDSDGAVDAYARIGMVLGALDRVERDAEVKAKADAEAAAKAKAEAEAKAKAKADAEAAAKADEVKEPGKVTLVANAVADKLVMSVYTKNALRCALRQHIERRRERDPRGFRIRVRASHLHALKNAHSPDEVVIEMETKTSVAAAPPAPVPASAPAPAPATLIPITTDSKSSTKSTHDATPMFSWWIFGWEPRFGAYLWWALTLLALCSGIISFVMAGHALAWSSAAIHVNCGNLSWGVNGECYKAGKLESGNGGEFIALFVILILLGTPLTAIPAGHILSRGRPPLPPAWILALLGLAIVITAFTWGVILAVRTTDSVHANCGNLSWGAEGECSKANKLQAPDGGLLAGGIILIVVFGALLGTAIMFGCLGVADECGCFAN